MPPRPISPSMVYALPRASARRAGSGWLPGSVMPGRRPELAEGAGAAWRESVDRRGEGLGLTRKSAFVTALAAAPPGTAALAARSPARWVTTAYRGVESP